ncbi:hypothetical protein D9V34_01145 [Mycetocola lacteus]|uniref:Prepilin type IV endopeptidase peptidase domain-containing protein n=1 Tax=Mycetocola lacteus TaxID=76637 RepID=A0A3L7AVU4_9MICO|nr:hypothetical protein [Mycetocola lacteus]RLP80852.1 hypothetical protein D9V34_13440 [Mycetocola lacteus]RLP84637.1 hypothetical protein D9V34_01145 [Mycetocola lacteus]
MLTTSTPRLASAHFPVPFVPPHPGPFDVPFPLTIAEPIVPAASLVTAGSGPIPVMLWPCLLWLLLTTPGLIRLDMRERRLPNRLIVPAALLLVGGVIFDAVSVASGGLGPNDLGPSIVGSVGREPNVVGPVGVVAASARDGPVEAFAKLIPALILAIVSLTLAAVGFWGGGDGKLAAVCLALLALTADPVGALSLFALLCGLATIVTSCHHALKRIRRRRGASPPIAPEHPDTPSGGILTRTIPLGPVLLGGLWGTLLILVVTGLPM